MERFIAATRNQGKLKEIREILAPLPLKVVSMDEAGAGKEIEENGCTFEENALIKARAIHAVTGGFVMADDSGLEVDWLNGAPGIYSARFGGEGVTDAERNRKLLELMAEVPTEKRAARFVCAIAVMLPDGNYFTVRGTCEGRIHQETAGENGFGYDPLFFLPEYNRTMAQLPSDEKNRISHRARALQKMLEILREKLQKT